MKKRYFAYLFFLVFFIGCKNKGGKLNEFVLTTFPDIKSGQILVLPGSGCSGCITDAENSIDSLLKIPGYRIIFSKIESLKTLKNRLRDKKIDVNDPHIFIDTEDLYFSNSEKYKDLWLYPTMITVKNKTVVKVAML